MRQFIKASIGVLIMIVVTNACNSNKKLESNLSMEMNITLKEGFGAKYLKQEYAEFDIDKVDRSNKTKNQYRAHLDCKNMDCSLLKNKLDRDAAIVSFQESESKQEVMTSKGSKATKVGPVGSKGNKK